VLHEEEQVHIFKSHSSELIIFKIKVIKLFYPLSLWKASQNEGSWNGWLSLGALILLQIIEVWVISYGMRHASGPCVDTMVRKRNACSIFYGEVCKKSVTCKITKKVEE
jgi:hypothetical protein